MLGVLRQTSGVKPLDGRYHGRMESAAPIMEQALVGHVVGEGMLEGVFEVWEEPCLQQQLGPLQASQARAELAFRNTANRHEECPRHVLADDRCSLEQALVLGGESIDASGQDSLDARRHLEAPGKPGEVVCPALADEPARLDQRSYALFEEEWVALHALEEEATDRPEGGIGAEDSIQQVLRARGR